MKIRAIHLLTEPNSEREIRSINSISGLQNFDIEYKQIINKLYSNKAPRENCARPNELNNIIKYMGLTDKHYGCYLAHSKGILNNINDDVDALLVFECDAIIIKDLEFFVKKVNEALEFCNNTYVPLFSFGPGEECIAKYYKNDIYTTDRIVDAHSYLIPNFKFEFIKNIIRNNQWDAFDYFLNENVAKLYGVAYFKDYLCLQAKGISYLSNEYSYENFLKIEKV